LAPLFTKTLKICGLVAFDFMEVFGAATSEPDISLHLAFAACTRSLLRGASTKGSQAITSELAAN
jgi:hypothetical protein